MLSLSALIGCAKVIKIYPITGADFAYIEKGKPSPITGIGMSEFYYNEVLQVKIDKK
jgi:hypothetical protein